MSENWGWGKECYQELKKVYDDEVLCYMDGRFQIIKYDGYDKVQMLKDYNKDQKKALELSSQHHYSFKTYVLQCGSYDGECIDLFQLQDWFDKNREWINSLRKELQTIKTSDEAYSYIKKPIQEEIDKEILNDLRKVAEENGK